jgi:hypothetical protein
MPVKETPIVVLTGALWVIITLLGMWGQWFPALLLSLVLMVAYAMLGSAHAGRIDSGLLAHPILTWAVVWALSFILADRYAIRFAGMKPDFTILGFHPSFAWIVLGYWLAGVAVLTVGFSLRKDRWLSDERWAEFERTVARLNAERGEATDGSGD